jgi:hypothetical protein
MNDFKSQRGCAIFASRNQQKTGRNRFAVEQSNTPFPRVAAQRGDLGLEVVAPLEKKTTTIH